MDMAGKVMQPLTLFSENHFRRQKLLQAGKDFLGHLRMLIEPLCPLVKMMEAFPDLLAQYTVLAVPVFCVR
jgi:hypothetical protein